MTARHSLFALASASLLAACAAGSGEADTGDGGNDDVTGGTTTGTGPTGSGPSTGSGNSGAGAGSTTTTGSGGASTTTGSGGDMTTGSTSSVGGGTTSSTATTTSTGGGSCLHDVCTEGPALMYGCGDPCVDTVCTGDPFCCDMQGGSWDSYCVDGAIQLCQSSCGSTGSISPGDLVITEIMNNPAAVNDADGEWFEIYNDAPYAIDLMGLDINHTANDPTAVHTISQSVVVPSGDYVVLGINANSSTNGGVNVAYEYSGVSLNNTVDYVALVDGTTVIDEVSWDEASGLDPSGASRSLDPIYTSASMNDSDQYFCMASSTMSGGDSGTPGGVNDACL